MLNIPGSTNLVKSDSTGLSAIDENTEISGNQELSVNNADHKQVELSLGGHLTPSWGDCAAGRKKLPASY